MDAYDEYALTMESESANAIPEAALSYPDPWYLARANRLGLSVPGSLTDSDRFRIWRNSDEKEHAEHIHEVGRIGRRFAKSEPFPLFRPDPLFRFSAPSRPCGVTGGTLGTVCQACERCEDQTEESRA